MGITDIVKDGWDLLTGQGEQKGKNVETNSAAPRDADQSQIWDSFMSSMFGSDAVNQDFDADYYLKNNPDVAKALGADPKLITDKDRAAAQKHYEKYGKNEGRNPYDPDTAQVKSLLERMTEDNNYNKTADTKLVDDVGGMRSDYLEGLKGTTNENIAANTAFGGQMEGLTDSFLSRLAKNTNIFNTNTDKVMNNLEPTATMAPVNLSMGGFSTPFITGSQRYAQGAYGDLNTEKNNVNNADNLARFDSQGALAALFNSLTKENSGFKNALGETTFNQNTAQAGAENQLARDYAPNKTENAYQNILQQLAQWSEGMRYSIPTTTSTGSYNPPTNISAGLGSLLQILQGGGGLPGAGGGGGTTTPPANGAAMQAGNAIPLM